MKQAILIVCGEEYERLPFLVEQFDERFNVYIHIDKKVIVPQKLVEGLKAKTGIRWMNQSFITNWGSMNLVNAILLLCEVALTEMVDIEDVINNEPIYSKSMLSFITEQFNVNLVEGVFRQRLLICIIKELLEERGVFVVRKGDDLMIDGRKLSVSIATKSTTSILIHTGLNILSEGAPVKASGLTSELGITDIKEFALEVMKRYSEEIEDINLASTKVRGV